jgi:integrase
MAIKKRGDTFYYDFSVRGVRYRGAIPEARTKYQAEQAESRIRDSVFDGKYGQAQSRIKFAEFAQKTYLPWALGSKRTGQDDEKHVGTLVGFFGNMPMVNISQILIEKFKRERAVSITRRGTLRRPASVNRELACLSKILSLARDNGYLREVPRIKLLREDNQRVRYLTRDEEECLLSSLTKSRIYLRPLVILALNTGMRLGEITGLTWQRVDFQRGCIYVTNTKNGKDRTLPMNEQARNVLLSLREEGDAEKVFTSLPNVSMSFPKACRKAGIEDFHFHDLRHTFATRLADSGVDVVTIAALLGHSSIQMATRYTHPTDERNRRAIQALSGQGQNVRQMRVTREGNEAKQNIA